MEKRKHFIAKDYLDMSRDEFDRLIRKSLSKINESDENCNSDIPQDEKYLDLGDMTIDEFLEQLGAIPLADAYKAFTNKYNQ